MLSITITLVLSAIIAPPDPRLLPKLLLQNTLLLVKVLCSTVILDDAHAMAPPAQLRLNLVNLNVLLSEKVERFKCTDEEVIFRKLLSVNEVLSMVAFVTSISSTGSRIIPFRVSRKRESSMVSVFTNSKLNPHKLKIMPLI